MNGWVKVQNKDKRKWRDRLIDGNIQEVKSNQRYNS